MPFPRITISTVLGWLGNRSSAPSPSAPVEVPPTVSHELLIAARTAAAIKPAQPGQTGIAGRGDLVVGSGAITALDKRFETISAEQESLEERSARFDAEMGAQKFIGTIQKPFRTAAETKAFLDDLKPGNFVRASAPEFQKGLKFLRCEDIFYVFETKNGETRRFTTANFHREVFKRDFPHLTRSVYPEDYAPPAYLALANSDNVEEAARGGFRRLTQDGNRYEITLNGRVYEIRLAENLSEFGETYCDFLFSPVRDAEEARAIFDGIIALHNKQNPASEISEMGQGSSLESGEFKTSDELLAGDYPYLPGDQSSGPNDTLRIHFAWKYGPELRTKAVLLALVDEGLIRRIE